MNTKRTIFLAIFLAIGLTFAIAATTALSAPRMARGDAMQPPTAAELALAPTHAKEWDALRADAIALRQVGREDLRSGFDALRTLLDQPAPDLRAFSRESQRKVDAHLAETRALRDRLAALHARLGRFLDARR
jgi:hypothetical protein